MNDLISIVIPVYNVESYIYDCLQSVSRQTYKNIEIILVNDGSTDTSGDICDKYILEEKRAIAVHKENEGLSEARNVGIRLAKGTYITFIDSDDFIAEDMIEYLYTLIVTYNSDISTCGHIICDEKGDEISKAESNIEQCFYGKELMMQFFTNKMLGTTAWGKLYSLKLFNDLEYPYGKIHEDVYTTYLLLDKSKGTVVGSKSKYWYRQHSHSIMKMKYSDKYLDAIDANLIRAKYIGEKYPECLEYANVGIVYACNKCFERMVISDYNDEKTELYIQSLIKKYMKCYLSANVKFINKAFTIVAAIDMKLARKLYIIIKGCKR